MDSLVFGHWPRDVDGDPEPIEWVVLDEVCGKKLLLSKEPLEHAHFVNELPRRSGRRVWPTWGYSDLRYWLNTTFLSYAFSEVERMRIHPTNLGPQSRPIPLDSTRRSSDSIADAVAAVEESRDIVDYVFCLSAEEVDKYLGLGEGAAASSNPYVSAVIGKKRAAYWWLRSNESGFFLIDAKGDTIHRCDIPGNGMKAVRPALWLAPDASNTKMQWTPGTRSHDYEVLSDYSLGQKQERPEAIVNIAIRYGDLSFAEQLLECGEEILWNRVQDIFSTWVGTATLGNLMRRGIIKPEQHLDVADLALFWKQYSFLAEFYPVDAIRSWSKIKVSPKAVRLIVPYLDAQTFKAKTQLGCILAENGYCDEIELLLGEEGKYFTKASLSRMRSTAEETGQDAVLRLLDKHM